MPRALVIGSLTVPHLATADLSQSYGELAARTLLRMADGTAVLRQAWAGKLTTDIAGTGPIPSGLLALDYSTPMTLKCVGEYALTSVSNVFANVTARRRSDSGATPYGRAYAAGQWVLTAVTWGSGPDANTATLGVVAGAEMYQLVFYPQITAFLTPPTQEWDWVSGDYSWSIHAEEA
jgi:hypothetical protein